MIRSVTTLAAGVAIAVLIVVIAVIAAVGVIGLTAKAALFGEPKTSLAMKVLDRLTHITPITPNKGDTK